MERFNLKKLNDVEGKETYRVEVSNRFATLFQISSPKMLNHLLHKNGVFWDVTPCGSCKNRRFGGT
jgi:hypothetical protein